MRMAVRSPEMDVELIKEAVERTECLEDDQNGCKTIINGCRPNKGGWKQAGWLE
jgi:hypothetical protein